MDLVKESPIGDGKRKTTKEWRAPGLDCVMLEQEYVIREGASHTRAVTVALDVRKGEPAGAIFALPPNLVESTNSDMLRAVENFARRSSESE